MDRAALDRRTRGKTRAGRLARLDAALLLYDRNVFLRRDGAFAGAGLVDLGFGESLATARQWLATVRQEVPSMRLIAMERDGRRARTAKVDTGAGITVVCGAFDAVATLRPRARALRAMNVLRQYRPSTVEAIHEILTAGVVPGGLVVEGTSDGPGARVVAHLLRGGSPHRREGLLFSSSFPRGFAPIMFRDQLPRDLRKAVVPGQPIFELFAEWTAAWESLADRRDPALAFRRSVEGLARRLPGIAADDPGLGDGHVLWRPPAGVPRAAAP